MTAIDVSDIAGDGQTLATLKADEDPRSVAEMKADDLDWTEGTIVAVSEYDDGTHWSVEWEEGANGDESRPLSDRPARGHLAPARPSDPSRRLRRMSIESGDKKVVAPTPPTPCKRCNNGRRWSPHYRCLECGR